MALIDKSLLNNVQMLNGTFQICVLCTVINKAIVLF